MSVLQRNHINRDYFWLAEKNGIAIATQTEQGQLVFNTAAIHLLDLEKPLFAFDELQLTKNFDDAFLTFTQQIGEDSSSHTMDVLVHGFRKTIIVSGMKSKSGVVFLTFQELGTAHVNADYLCQYATNTDDLFIVVSNDSKVLFVSESFELLFERSSAELQEGLEKIADWVDQRDKSVFEEVLLSFKENILLDTDIEFRITSPDNTTKWLSYTRKIIFNGEGEAYRSILIFADITKRKYIENELVESELNYREIYNATNDAIFIHNAETGKIEDVNNAMLEMYGLTYEQALNSNFASLTVNGDSSTEEKALKSIRESFLKPQIFEWNAIKSDGTEFWVEVSLKRGDIHGKPKVIAVVRNITERKSAELLLSENEGKYKLIVEGQSELIVRLNSKGTILFASPSLLRVLEKTDEELINTPFVALTHPHDQEYLKLVIDKMSVAPNKGFFEFRIATKNGERWFAWNYSALTYSQSSEPDIICVGRDITYQKMVESALRESEDRFRSIVQHLSDVVFLIDEKANIKYVTPSCEQYIGVGVEEMLGNNLLNFIHSDDQWFAQENITLHQEGTDYSLPYEIRMRHASKTWKVFEAKSQNMLDHPSVKSIVFTVSDITDRKLMEKQVLDAIIKTEEKERERFAKDLHDDLGPLLSSIKMYVGMLGKVEKEEKREFILKNLQEIVKEAITTTKDVSNDLNPHVLNNYGLISALRLFVDKISEDLHIDFHGEIGDARYSTAIELSLYRISKELINNTLKHAEASNIVLKIWEQEGQLNLTFEDDGKGLPSEAFKVKKPGGMGLSNIISRAKSLNGLHTFHTNLDKGFKFEMQVPLVQD